MSDPNVYICDFNDSFTFNIYSKLKLINSDLTIEVIPLSEIESFLLKLKDIDRRVAVVLGPGPGKPTDYSFLFNRILEISQNNNIFLMGICLGHQLYWSSQGYEVIKCLEPIHGQTQTYILSSFLSSIFNRRESIEVQRYNSLKVNLNLAQIEKLSNDKGALIHNNELVLYKSELLVTYQFHPESVGTKDPDMFFDDLLSHIL